jgi:RNA polymerase sigma factor (sigma-70 family)
VTADLILKYQDGDKDAALMLISKFNPLLKKYAYKLGYEDSYNDLLVDFLILVKDMKLKSLRKNTEGAIVSYISKSIKHSYIEGLQKLKNYNRIIMLLYDLSLEEQYFIETKTAVYDHYNIFISDIGKYLTKYEFNIIFMIYSYGYSISELAEIEGVTRQAVNQAKNRALSKLKDLLPDKLG